MRRTRKTSKEAYQKIAAEGLLPKRRLEVYGHLFRKGPATAREVEDSFVELGFEQGRHVNKRLPELRDQGVVEEVGERKCLVTGQKAIEWDVTAALPKPLPRKVSGLKPIIHKIKECKSCMLVDEHEGRDVCWLDLALYCCEEGRHKSCPLLRREFHVQAG